MAVVTIACAQINTTAGDLGANARQILQAARWASEHGADVLITPELALTGYPPEDLLLRPAFIQRQQHELDDLRRELAGLRGLHVVVGCVHQQDGRLYNAACVLLEGQVSLVYCKQELPDYGVFDETRYFRPGQEAAVFEVRGLRLGINICEDAWFEAAPGLAAGHGAQALLVLNASPYSRGKTAQRTARLAANAAGMSTVYVNQVGGQDELVFDGASFALDAQGQVAARLPVFEPALGLVQLDAADGSPVQGQWARPDQPQQLHASLAEWPGDLEQVYGALRLALRDYLAKTGFRRVVLGLSGGIDSALVLALAVDVLGAAGVRTVMMPTRYTSEMSLQDARSMAQGLGVAYDILDIEPLYAGYRTALAPLFGDLPVDATEENIQARIRGTLLMAMSNKFGSLLLSTGNKSELATGYCTLYGDMAGGYAPLKDLPKTLVYDLARWRNGCGAVIPERIITRPPSAELREDQTDQDSLPEYEVLDAIMERYVERNESVEDIVRAGYPREAVALVTRLVRINEYKRRQGAVGPKITSRAFGRDWRLPIANGFRD